MNIVPSLHYGRYTIDVVFPLKMALYCATKRAYRHLDDMPVLLPYHYLPLNFRAFSKRRQPESNW